MDCDASIDLILMAVDHAIQYHDDVEPREPRDDRDPVDEDDAEGHDSGSYAYGEDD